MLALYDAKSRLKRKGRIAQALARLVRVEHAAVDSSAPALCRVHLRNGAAVEFARAPAHWSALLVGVVALP